MISSKNEHVFTSDSSELSIQIILDDRSASMNVGLQEPIAWNNSRHLPLWRFYSHCGIEEPGSPGNICIVCYQVLRHPSEHRTSSIGKDLLAKAQSSELNELTEAEVTEFTISMVDVTVLAIPKCQGNRGIRIVCSLSQIIFNVQVIPYCPNCQTQHSDVPAKDIETSEFHQDIRNRWLMLELVSANIQLNAISNLELRRSYKSLSDDLTLPSPTTLSNIWRREYALTKVVIRKQSPWLKIFSLSLDRWTSTNKLAIRSVIAYYMDRS